MVQEVIIIAIIGCWISEWSTLVQKLEWWISNKIPLLNCSKCLSFWLGLLWGVETLDGWFGLVFAILCSASAQVFNKIYMRL